MHARAGWNRKSGWLVAAFFCAQLVGCGGELGGSDAGRPDAASTTPDASAPSDAGTRSDAATADAAPRDAGPSVDAASSVDAGSMMGVSRPSMGSGGAFPGEQSRMAGGVPYTIYLPTAYDPSRPVPLLSVFHGQGGSAGNMVRFWTDLANAEGFALLATTATGSSGGWVPSTDVARYDMALTDALAAYNIEQARHYVWGFSAGAHLVHALALQNTDLFTAYSVSAGVLDALAGAGAPAAAAYRIPVDIHIGDSDPLFAGAMMDRGRFTSAGWTEGVDFEFRMFSGGHELRPEHRAEIWAFLEPWVR